MTRPLPPSPYAEVIGDPIAHSKSPVIHGYWLEQLEIDGRYTAMHVRPEGLETYLEARREDPDWRGCNVTIPHKQAVIPLLDCVNPRAASIGAVNTIWRDGKGRLCGTNTDVDGVAEAIAGLNHNGCRAVVLGAGGAARSAFAHLAGLGCASTKVLARNRVRAAEALEDCGLAAQVLPFEGDTGAFVGAGLVINATQLGMQGQRSMPDFVLSEIAQTAGDCLVFDMVYAPLQTDLLSAAQRQGRHSVGGLIMLVGQARSAFARFFGATPPPDHDAKLYERLTG